MGVEGPSFSGSVGSDFSDFRCYTHKSRSGFTKYWVGFGSVTSGFGSDQIVTNV